MKHILSLLFISAILLSATAQDSLKTVDSTKKFNEKLAEVYVTARRPMMVQEIDKTVVDVKGMAGSASLNTVELLERIPGVNVSPSGEISLNGKGGVLVLMDGRATYMSAQDLISYLKAIPAGNLDKIELIDNPSAKYDASGNAVINIRLRKNRAAGIHGNFSSGGSHGRYAATNNSLNLNYNRKKLNLFGNFGLSTFKEYNDEYFDRKFYDNDNNISSKILLDNKQVLNSRNINIYTGFDYNLSSRSSIGGNFNYSRGRRENDFGYLSNAWDGAGVPLESGSGYTDAQDKRKNISVSLNYLLQLNKNGHELSADVNILKHDMGSNRLQYNSLSDPNNAPVEDDLFRYVVPMNSNITVFKADYVRPFANKVRIEAGVKSSIISNNNISNYFDQNGTEPVLVPANSNHFKYDENINAAYVNIAKTWKRWQAQFGTRVEDLSAKGNQLGNEVVAKSVFRKNNTELFPSAFITYKLDTVNKNSFTLTALRRISRPNYAALNPFVFIKDEYTYTSGNPDLNAQFQYRLELKFQHKQLYWFQLSYNKFNQLVFNMSEVVNEKYVNKPKNIGRGSMALLSAGLNISPAKWLNSNNTLRIARLSVVGNESNELLKRSLFAVRFETMTFFTISKTISAELNAYIASTDIIGQAVSEPMFRVNAGISKKILSEKGSIRLGVDDVFHSWQYRNNSIGLNRSSFYQNTVMDTRRITAGFSYRFGKDANGKRKRQGGVNDDEKGRLE